MRRLHLSLIPEDFDPERDIASGPWCFLGREDIYPDWDTLPRGARAFATLEEFEAAERRTTAHAESLLFSMVPELNALNGTRHGWPFWRLMALPWLRSLVQTTYERQQFVRNLAAKFGGEALEVALLAQDFPFRFADTGDFVNATQAPLYNWWLLSRVVERLAPSAWVLHYVVAPVPKQVLYRPATPIVRTGWRRLLNDRRCAYVYGCSAGDLTFFSLLLAAKGLFRRRAKQWPPPANPGPQIDWLLDFDALFHHSIPQSLRDVSSLKTEDFRTRPGTANLTGPDLYYTDWLKYRLSLKSDGGERLFCSQHGAAYGSLRYMTNQRAIEYAHEVFLTWGWHGHEAAPGRFVPLPSPLLSAMSSKYRKANDRLLFISTSQPALHACLDALDLTGFLLDYRRSQRAFFQGLCQEILAAAWFRPYCASGNNFDNVRNVARVVPAIDVLEGDLHQEVLRCKLAVLDNLGTTFYLSMAADTPSIMYWNPEYFKVCAEAEPLFARLRAVGILCYGPQEALRQVHAVWDDVEGWWQSPEVRRARQEWLDRQALVSRHWRLKWAWKLLQLG